MSATSKPYPGGEVDGWINWQTTTTTSKPADPAWGAWETGYDYQTFTKYSTITYVSKCSVPGCKDQTSTKTVPYTTVYPTITVYKTEYVEVCSTGLTSKPATVTVTCKDGCSARPTGAPPGYTVTKVWCNACATPQFVDVTSTVYVYSKPTDGANNNNGNNNGGNGNNYGGNANGNGNANNNANGNGNANNNAAASSWSVWNSGASPAAATPVAGVASTWNSWGNGASPAAATPVAGISSTWNSWNTGASSPAAATPAVGASSTWNDWNVAGATGSPAQGTGYKVPDSTTGANSPVKTYTGAAAKQIVSGSVLAGALVAVFFM